MHHGNNPDDFKESLQEFYGEEAKFGATGKFPEGKLVPSDEGEIAFGITHKNGKVVMSFGKPVAWVGFGPAQATELAGILRKHALLIQPKR